MRRSLSLVAQSAWHDLVRSLEDDMVTDLRGTPTRVLRGNKIYWYDSWRLGSEVRKTYLGEDSPALADRLAKAADLAARKTDADRHRARLIRILRAEGMAPADQTTGPLLSALAKVGLFRLGGTLVGTAAFRLYEGELGVHLRFDEMVQTDDIDIASFERLSLAVDDHVTEPLAETLSAFRFEAVPNLDAGKAWRWKQSGSQTLVEFLTPSFDEDEGLRPLAALGVEAQSLHHLNYLIAQPVKAALLWRSGVLVQIPRPERYAVHKLIVADRRAGTDRIKAAKDRAQAAFLIAILAEDRPGDLLDAFEDAIGRGPQWRSRIANTLRRMPDTAGQLTGIGAVWQ